MAASSGPQPNARGRLAICPADRGAARRAGGRGYSTARDLNALAEALKSGRRLKPQTLNQLKAEQLKMTRRGGPIDATGLGFGAS